MLTKPAIHELKIEETSLDLMEEFLSEWFDGQAHAVGANPAVVFPEAVLRFQQSAVPQPLNGVAITLVWAAPTRVDLRWEEVSDTLQQMAYARCQWAFWVRAAGGGARRLCMEAADRLAGLLGNAAARKPLGQKGIHRLRCGLPQAVADAAHSVRMVPCAATLRYAVRSQA